MKVRKRPNLHLETQEDLLISFPLFILIAEFAKRSAGAFSFKYSAMYETRIGLHILFTKPAIIKSEGVRDSIITNA